MTHDDIYRRLARFDVKSTYAMIGYLVLSVAVLLLVAAVIPDSWLAIVNSDSNAQFVSLYLDESTRFVTVPATLTIPFLVVSLVTGVVTAAESRSYLGAGVTRTASWWDARRTNIAVAIVLTLVIGLSFLIALALDGSAHGITVGQSVTSGGLYVVSLLAAFEVGYLISLTFTRFLWFPATLMTIMYSGILLLAMTQWGDSETEIWPWYRILAVAILVAVTLPGSFAMMKTMPMRRSG